MKTKKRKVIAIAFSDIQIENWHQFNQNSRRLIIHDTVFSTVSALCRKHKVPALFCGDLFDNPKSLKNKVLQYFVNSYKAFFEDHKIPVLAISGNHDQSESNTLQHTSPNYVDTFSKVFNTLICLDNKELTIKGTTYYGIPYFKNENGFKESLKSVSAKARKNSNTCVLLIHRDLWGAKEPNGYTRDEIDDIPNNLPKVFKSFDLVLSGHIHKPQMLYPHIYMLGATHHQRKSDKGCDMGIWLVYSDCNLQFVKLKMPKFKEGKKPNGFDFVIPPVEELKSEDVPLTDFQSLKPLSLANAYAKAEGIDVESSKISTLKKYLI